MSDGPGGSDDAGVAGEGSAVRSCPCGSGAEYAQCCGPLHEGGDAITAEALMRSRYSAYALGLEGYLRRSWHASTRPLAIELDDGTQWRRLQIVDRDRGAAGDDAGVVEYRAAYRTPHGSAVLHERSRFRRENGHWFYVDGDILT
ncbi:YchJ family metal-binding protein [Tersicoccus sp. MR15.9]|uniref:YchJ family protein n=1 Tax=Tersicoccus mangrovi TaxID=3121635 RepID=UPI002FE5B23E